jgi:hypothetical protein
VQIDRWVTWGELKQAGAVVSYESSAQVIRHGVKRTPVVLVMSPLVGLALGSVRAGTESEVECGIVQHPGDAVTRCPGPGSEGERSTAQHAYARAGQAKAAVDDSRTAVWEVCWVRRR